MRFPGQGSIRGLLRAAAAGAAALACALPAGAQSRVEIPVAAGAAYQAFLKSRQVATDGRISLAVGATPAESQAMLVQAVRAVGAIESLFTGMRRRSAWQRLTVWCIDDRNAFLGAVRAVGNADAGNAGGMCCDRGDEVHVFVHGRDWRLVRHELWHAVSGPYLPEMDPWLNEGMAEVLADAVDLGDSLALGGVTADRLARCRAMVARGGWVPLPIFLQRGQQWGDQLRQGMQSGPDQYLQAWALVHHLMFADNGRHRPILVRMMAELNAGRDQRSALHATVGSSPQRLQEWEREVATWLAGAEPVDLAAARAFLEAWAGSEPTAFTMSADELRRSLASRARREGSPSIARAAAAAASVSDVSRSGRTRSVRVGPVDGGAWTVRWQAIPGEFTAKPSVAVEWSLR